MNMDEIKRIHDILASADCYDPFVCIFGMYGKNKKGFWGCYARRPDGKPDGTDHGCIAKQAAKAMEALMAAHEEE